MKAWLTVAIATLSATGFAQPSRDQITEQALTQVFAPASEASDLTELVARVRVVRAFMDHYWSFATDGVQGKCEGRLTLTDDGYLTSIDLTRCTSDAIRQAVYRRLAAAVPFPPLPDRSLEVWGTF